jgi:hypothetical protein
MIENALVFPKAMYLRDQGVLFVMPAKAGIQFTRYRIFWIPAFAGMTVCISENSPTAYVFKGANYVR